MRAIVLGVVQGIAEFLPISSSGHIVIVDSLMAEITGKGFGESALSLNVALHIGSLLSILAVFWRDIVALRTNPRLCAIIALASVPVGVVGLALEEYISRAFMEPLFPAMALLFTAMLLLLGQKYDSGTQELDRMPWRRAFVIGIFQAIAIIPGISRSGSTIAGGLLLGLDRKTAARFSFLLAIPPIAGAGMLKSFDLREAGTLGISVWAILAGMLTSFAVGYYALQWLLAMITNRQLHRFAMYCVVVAALTAVWRVPVLLSAGSKTAATAVAPIDRQTDQRSLEPASTRPTLSDAQQPDGSEILVPRPQVIRDAAIRSSGTHRL